MVVVSGRGGGIDDNGYDHAQQHDDRGPAGSQRPACQPLCPMTGKGLRSQVDPTLAAASGEAAVSLVTVPPRFGSHITV